MSCQWSAIKGGREGGKGGAGGNSFRCFRKKKENQVQGEGEGRIKLGFLSMVRRRVTNHDKGKEAGPERVRGENTNIDLENKKNRTKQMRRKGKKCQFGVKAGQGK